MILDMCKGPPTDSNKPSEIQNGPPRASMESLDKRSFFIASV